MVLAGRVLVVCDELHNGLLRAALHLVWPTLTSDLEVDTVAGFWVDTAHVPETGVADTALGLANGYGLLVARDGVANQSRHLELLGGQDLEAGIEAHEQVVVGVLVKDTGE